MIPPIIIDGSSHGGDATAVATLQTALWAGQRDLVDEYFDCFTPEIKEEFQNARAKEVERAKSGTTSPRCSGDSTCEQLSGVLVCAQNVVSDSEVELEYEFLFAGRGVGRKCRQPFRKVGEDWKISGPPQEVR